MEFWLINELDSPQITDFCLIEIETDFAAFPAQLLYTCRTASIFLAMATPGWFSPVPLPRARTCSRRRCMKWDLRNNCKALGSQLPGPQPSPRVHEELYPSWPAHGAITTRTALTVWTWGHLVEWSVWKQTALEPPQWPFNAAGVQQWRSGWGLPQTLAALGWSSARRGGWLGASTLQPPLFVFVPQGPNQEEERNRASAFWEARSSCTVGPCRLGWMRRLFPAGPNSLSGTMAFAGCKADGDYQLLAGMLLEGCSCCPLPSS